MKKKQVKAKKVKQPSLLRKVIEVYYENAQMSKATRNLKKLTWSYDFLKHIVEDTAKSVQQTVTIELIKADGTRILISSTSKKTSVIAEEDSIFNHLDNVELVDKYIREHATR